MKKRPYLSVIIPAYNEEKSLADTLVDVDKYLKDSGFDYEIIIVENNSTDATFEVAKKLTGVINNLQVLSKKTAGKGEAVKIGMLEAKGEIRLFMDADNATTLDQFSKMIPYFEQNYGAVIGSRDIKGAKKVPPQPWYKTILGNLGNIFIQIVLLPGYWDTQCGFKAFTAEAAEKIFPILKTNRWGFDAEVLALAKKFGYKIKEIPVIWVSKSVSRVKATTYLEVLWEVCKIRYWLWTNQY